jgi:hypothetical protein
MNILSKIKEPTRKLTFKEKFKVISWFLIYTWIIATTGISFMYFFNWKVEIKPNVESFQVITAEVLATSSAVLK